jgi:cysteine-rich repeat protein
MRRLGGVATFALLLASGCIDSDLVECGDGRACRVGSVCATLTENAAPLCLAPEQLAPCASAGVLEPCEVGACYESSVGLVCLPSGCGNGLRDQGEVCDDGNADTGDGCSGSCLSNETCGNGIVDPLPATGMAEQCDDGNFVGHDGCASDCQSEAPSWTSFATTAPDAVYAAGWAYDSARDRIVMFGGAFQVSPIPVPRGVTFEWDGTGWLRIPAFVSPSGRAAAFMAYDAERRRTVLFGGSANTNSTFDDTWEWDGATWTLRTPATRPSPRRDGGMVYDAARKRIVLFGGLAPGGQPLDDTWEWDGTDWREIVVTTRPPARNAAGMTYDPVRAVTVLAGGGGAVPRNDTWEFDGTTWRNIATATTPADMTTSRFAFDGTHIISFGGFNGARATGTTYRYDGQTWSVALAEGSAPSARGYAMLSYDPNRDRVIMFGGLYASSSPSIWMTRGDTFAWNGSGWTELLTVQPAPRALHAATFDTFRGRMIIHGGSDGLFSSTDHADSWALVGAHWEQLTPAPPARHNAAMAYDAKRKQAVLFGGSIGNASQSDTWILDGNSWTQVTPATVPPIRNGHSMAYDPMREVVVMFGGSNNNVGKTDTWEWNGIDWTVRLMTGPPARAGASMGWDPLRQRIVLFGGEGMSRTLNDTWEYDGATWTDVSGSQAPPPRGFTDIAWNAPRRAHTVYAGSSGTFAVLDDTWERRSSDWAQQPIPAAPVARQGATSAPLADGVGIVVFGGGVLNTIVNDLWHLRWRNTGRYELCTVDVDEDRDGLAGCADPDCWATCTPECPPGASCNMAWPRCGNGTCEPRENCRICPGDCACTPVCGDNVCDPGETNCAGDC